MEWNSPTFLGVLVLVTNGNESPEALILKRQCLQRKQLSRGLVESCRKDAQAGDRRSEEEICHQVVSRPTA
ncbi:hypothetical protein AGOR_G00013480 [Albula goreensis]|uniref:Uncharacterized protein n=1 Tax=Albula goreensis TaxID=1534307 RepID=A0A8T3E8B4_9TELE|nr:hypothetical protein AGOR_G00013480 [Albula goreensis]